MGWHQAAGKAMVVVRSSVTDASSPILNSLAVTASPLLFLESGQR